MRSVEIIPHAEGGGPCVAVTGKCSFSEVLAVLTSGWTVLWDERDQVPGYVPEVPEVYPLMKVPGILWANLSNTVVAL